jgi:hypothetical protein
MGVLRSWHMLVGTVLEPPTTGGTPNSLRLRPSSRGVERLGGARGPRALLSRLREAGRARRCGLSSQDADYPTPQSAKIPHRPIFGAATAHCVSSKPTAHGPRPTGV